MSGYARIESVDALRSFRSAMVKFTENARVALGDAEGEISRMLVWLETEANTYWSSQIRKRHDWVEKCKEAVRQKKLFKSPTGNTQSAVEEEKALRVAIKREEEAVEKLKNVRRYVPRLQKEISIYRGGVQRLSTALSADIPLAIGRLDKMVQALDAYAALSVSGAGGAGDAGELFQRMARALGEAETQVDYKPLRQKTAAVDRKAGVAADVRLEMWSDGMVTEKERELFSKIESDKTPLPPTASVLVEEGAWTSANIYLERVAAAEGDTGWYLGRADGEAAAASAGKTLAAQLGDLLETRQDLREVLALPVGYLVVIGPAGVSAVLDDKGRELWAGIRQ
jgi:hypothetical protein